MTRRRAVEQAQRRARNRDELIRRHVALRLAVRGGQLAPHQMSLVPKR